MLVYTGTFPISNSATPEQIINVARRWLSDSPHYRWADTDFPSAGGFDGITEVAKYGQQIQYGILTAEENTLAAFRQSWNDRDQIEWITEITASFREDHSPVFCVRVHCNALVAGLTLTPPRKPYLVRMVLEHVGGGLDGEFEVSDVPHQISSDDIMLGTQIVDGSISAILPVVYVSASHGREAYADPDGLARQLSGSAHVVLEPSRKYSFDLLDATGGRNTYGGAVGLYWARGTGVHSRYLPHRYRPGELERVVVEDVRKIACESQPLAGTTWSAVEQAQSAISLDALRADRSTNIEEWIQAFEGEKKAAQDQLTSAKREIERLRSQIRAMQAGASVGGAVLNMGNETDLFPGEIAEALIATLKGSRANIKDDSRTGHILDDLIAANPIGTKRSERASSVKGIVSDVKRFTNRQIEQLEDLGFEISSDGKHHKAVFGGDPRYQFSIPKTSSDHRAGKNLASEINSALFK